MTRFLVILIFLAALGVGGYFLYTKVIQPKSDNKTGQTTTNNPVSNSTGTIVADVPVTLLTTLNKNSDLSKFKEAINKVGKDIEWEANSEYTFFIPDNTAFNALGTEKLNSLFSDAKKEELTSLVKTHIVKGKVSSAELLKKEELENLNEDMISIKIENGAFLIDKSLLKTPDLVSDKVTIHILEKVIE